jgi:hypothetical protein
MIVSTWEIRKEEIRRSKRNMEYWVKINKLKMGIKNEEYCEDLKRKLVSNYIPF